MHDNLRNLGLDVLDAVNLRLMGGADHGPAEESLEERFTALAELQRQGLIRHLGISNVTPTQVAEAQRITRALRGGPHIFNLGHGITPDANPDNVAAMIEAVRTA